MGADSGSRHIPFIDFDILAPFRRGLAMGMSARWTHSAGLSWGLLFVFFRVRFVPFVMSMLVLMFTRFP